MVTTQFVDDVERCYAPLRINVRFGLAVTREWLQTVQSV